MKTARSKFERSRSTNATSGDVGHGSSSRRKAAVNQQRINSNLRGAGQQRSGQGAQARKGKSNVKAQQSATSAPTTMPTVGSSVTQKNKSGAQVPSTRTGQAAAKREAGGANPSARTAGTDRNRNLEAKPVSVFGPAASISAAKRGFDTPQENLQHQSADQVKLPAGGADKVGQSTESFPGYKSVMSVAYKSQTRNTRFFGKGKQISSFRAEANVQKKDISDSNVVPCSEDEIQKPGVGAQRKFEQQSSGHNSFDDSGVIQEEAPIAIVMDSRNHASTSMGFREPDKQQLITQKIGKVGMSGINSMSCVSSVSGKRNSVANLSGGLNYRLNGGKMHTQNFFRSRLESPNNAGNTLGLFDKLKGMKGFGQYRTVELAGISDIQQPATLSSRPSNFNSFEQYKHNKNYAVLDNSIRGKRDAGNKNNFNSTQVLLPVGKDQQQFKAEYQIVPNLILTQSRRESVKPMQKTLAISAKNNTESVQDTSMNPTSGKKDQFGGDAPRQVSLNLNLQLQNDSTLSRHASKPITPLTGTDAMNPLCLPSEEVSAQLTPSNLDLAGKKAVASRSDNRDVYQKSSAEISTVRQQQSNSPGRVGNDQTANSYLNHIVDGSSNYLEQSQSKSYGPSTNAKHTIPNEMSEADAENPHIHIDLHERLGDYAQASVGHDRQMHTDNDAYRHENRIDMHGKICRIRQGQRFELIKSNQSSLKNFQEQWNNGMLTSQDISSEIAVSAIPSYLYQQNSVGLQELSPYQAQLARQQQQVPPACANFQIRLTEHNPSYQIATAQASFHAANTDEKMRDTSDDIAADAEANDENYLSTNTMQYGSQYNGDSAGKQPNEVSYIELIAKSQGNCQARLNNDAILAQKLIHQSQNYMRQVQNQNEVSDGGVQNRLNDRVKQMPSDDQQEALEQFHAPGPQANLSPTQEDDIPMNMPRNQQENNYVETTVKQTFSPQILIDNNFRESIDSSLQPAIIDGPNYFSKEDRPSRASGCGSEVIRQVSLHPSISTSSQRIKNSKLYQQSINECNVPDPASGAAGQLKIVYCDCQHEEDGLDIGGPGAPQEHPGMLEYISGQAELDLRRSHDSQEAGVAQSRSQDGNADGAYSFRKHSINERKLSDDRKEQLKCTNQQTYLFEDQQTSDFQLANANKMGLQTHRQQQSSIFGIKGPDGQSQSADSHNICEHILQQSNFQSQIEAANAHSRLPQPPPTHKQKLHCSICASLNKNQARTGLTYREQLENSCVTFQYYNSSKFASNSTNQDRNGQNIQNCFYFTKTTNKTNQSDNINTQGYNTKQTEYGQQQPQGYNEQSQHINLVDARQYCNQLAQLLDQPRHQGTDFVQIQDDNEVGEFGNGRQRVSKNADINEWATPCNDFGGDQQIMIQDSADINQQVRQNSFEEEAPRECKHTRIQDLLLRQSETYYCDQDYSSASQTHSSARNAHTRQAYYFDNVATKFNIPCTSSESIGRSYGDPAPEEDEEEYYDFEGRIKIHANENIIAEECGGTQPYQQVQYGSYGPAGVLREVLEEYDVIQEQSSKDEQSKTGSFDSQRQSRVSAASRAGQLEQSLPAKVTKLHSSSESSSVPNDGLQNQMSTSDQPYRDHRSKLDQQPLIESNLDALASKKMTKTGEQRHEDGEQFTELSNQYSENFMPPTVNPPNQEAVPADQRASSVMGPQSNKIVNHDARLELQRAYCSLGSSRHQTPNSHDQSYTILQMASSTQKIALNSNFVKKYKSIKSPQEEDASEDNYLYSTKNANGAAAPTMLKANAFSLSQHRSDSGGKPHKNENAYFPEKEQPIIIQSKDDYLDADGRRELSRPPQQKISTTSDIYLQTRQVTEDRFDNQIKMIKSCPNKTEESQLLVAKSSKKEAEIEKRNDANQRNQKHADSSVQQADMFAGIQTLPGVDSALVSSLFNNLNQLTALCSNNNDDSHHQPERPAACHQSLPRTEPDQFSNPMIIQNSTINQSESAQQKSCRDSLKVNNKYSTFDQRARPKRAHDDHRDDSSQLHTINDGSQATQKTFEFKSKPADIQCKYIDQQILDQMTEDRRKFEEQIEYINELALRKTRQSPVIIQSQMNPKHAQSLRGHDHHKRRQDDANAVPICSSQGLKYMKSQSILSKMPTEDQLLKFDRGTDGQPEIRELFVRPRSDLQSEAGHPEVTLTSNASAPGNSNKWQKQFRSSRSRSGVRSNGRKSQRSSGQNFNAGNIQYSKDPVMLTFSSKQSMNNENQEASQNGGKGKSDGPGPAGNLPAGSGGSQRADNSSLLKRSATATDLPKGHDQQPSTAALITISKIHLLPAGKNLGSKKNSMKAIIRQEDQAHFLRHHHSHQQSKELSHQIDHSIQQLNSLRVNIQGHGEPKARTGSRRSEVSHRSSKEQQPQRRVKMPRKRQDRNNSKNSSIEGIQSAKQKAHERRGQDSIDADFRLKEKASMKGPKHRRDSLEYASNENQQRIGNSRTAFEKASPAV